MIKMFDLTLFTCNVMLCLAFVLSLSIVPALAQESSVDAIIDSYEKLIETNPNYEKIEDIYYELGTLYFQQENEQFERAYAAYLDDVRANPESEEAPPEQTFERTIAHYLEFLERFPGSAYTDDVYYHLAFCYQEQMDWETALTYYERIVTEYPDSPFAAESHFRRGEIAFEEDMLELALESYQHVLEYRTSPLYDEALYKLGWTHYRLNNYADAISIMITVIDNFSEMGDNPDKGSQVIEETLTYLSICLSEYGDARTAEKIFNKMDQKRWYERDVYARLGQIFFLRNLYQNGIDAYEIFLDHFPNDPNAPLHVNEMVEQADRENLIEPMNEFKTRLVYVYDDSSEWRQANPVDTLLAKVDSLRANRLIELATYYHRNGNEHADRDLWQSARTAYNDFLNYFPQHPKREYALFRMADCDYRLGNLATSAETYLQLATEYETGEYAEESRYNAVVCYSEILEATPNDSTTLAHLEQKAQAFETDYPISERLQDVLFAWADGEFNAKNFQQALTIYAKITDYLDFDRAILENAALMAGKSAFQLDQFSESERWFRKAENTGGSAGGNSQATELTQRALYEQAREMLAAGDSISAARMLLKTDREIPYSDVGGVALLKAGEIFEQQAEWQSAADTWRRFLEDFPSHEEWARILWREAYTLEKAGHDLEAAQRFSRIPDQNPTDENIGRAYIEAIRIYHKNEKWHLVLQNIDKLQASGAMQANEPNILYLIGKAHYELGHDEEARSGFETFLAQPKGTDSHRAEASFLLGEMLFPTYRAMTIKNPVEKTLAEKQDAFGEVMAFYTEALNAGVAEWSTAASYRIGLLFEDFAEKLADSPRPSGLTDEEKEMYEAALAEQTAPYLQEAKGVYQKIVDEAEAESYHDEWLDKIVVRLEELNGQEESQQ